MNCNECRFLILKHTSQGPLCFKGIDIKTAKSCNSFEKLELKDLFKPRHSDLSGNKPLTFDYAEIEVRSIAQSLK